MAVAADLRAASHQRVRIDHGAVADVSADVHVHRRHADHAFADDSCRRECSIRRARCARHRRRRTGAPGTWTCRRNGCRSGSIDISTIEPIRKPTRMPFLTQPFTRQPLGSAASGSAARIAPAFSACFEVGEQREVFRRVFAPVGYRKALQSPVATSELPRRPAGRPSPVPVRSSVCLRRAVRPSAAGKRVRAGPSPTWPTSPGSDSLRRS